MKKMIWEGMRLPLLLLIFFACTASTSTTSESVKWNDWLKGYSTFESEKKILLVDLYTDWCYWCKVMDKETYSQKSVAQMIEKEFIPVKLNPEKENTYTYEGKSYTGAQLANVLTQGKLQGYPTTLFLTPNKKAYVYSGFYKEPEFNKLLAEIVKKSKAGE